MKAQEATAPSKSTVKAAEAGRSTTAHDMLSAYGFNAIKLVQKDGSICRVQSLKIIRFHAEDGKKRFGLDLRPKILLNKSRKTIKSFTGDSVLPKEFNDWLEITCSDYVHTVIRDLMALGYRQESLSPVKIDVKIHAKDISKTEVSRVQSIKMRNDYSYIREIKELSNEEKERQIRDREIADLRWSIQDVVSRCRKTREKIDETLDAFKQDVLREGLKKSEDKLVGQMEVLQLWTDGKQSVEDADFYVKQYITGDDNA